jgi:HPr kinase/phosphorylase
MGCEISTVKLPIYPGKNVTVIAEVIAMNYLLKTYGYDAAQVFADNLSKEIIKNKGKKGFIDKRHITYFQADDE